MCSGIGLTGFLITLACGNTSPTLPLPIVVGGALWAMSNYAVVPLVHLLGPPSYLLFS